MTNLEKIKNWISTYSGYDVLSDFQVDYTNDVPGFAGIFPSGLVEVNRKQDIFGNVTVTNQLNFAIYSVFEKSPGDDIGATINAEWVADFQLWVQEQSITGLAPVFGDVPSRERITAQNGQLYQADEEGTAMYMVQLSIQYIKRFER